MAKQLPYRATTASGECLDITFPLHSQTVSPVRVSQMLSAVLEAIDREVKLDPVTSNGDVLQAVAMALAIRASMIEAPKENCDRLVSELVRASLKAMDGAARSYPYVGHA